MRAAHWAGWALVSALAVAAPAAAGEGFQGGFRGGQYLGEGPFFGGELVARFGPRFAFNPNLEHRVTTYVHYTALNADFHVDFPASETTLLWVTIGVGAVLEDPKDHDESATVDFGTNFAWAVGFRSGSVMPYLQARVVRTHETVFSLGFGLRF